MGIVEVQESGGKMNRDFGGERMTTERGMIDFDNLKPVHFTPGVKRIREAGN